ncbi:bifunctional metallophosphatase/5'-nucleotidase [Vreelandella utahensis]|uniref:bifunctional metallophosphatase/5'-nucleotidase n=1 Tax=Vreelandella halophila TaxID=86177 RepID=UPI0009847400|nr:5'-nucleotidase C-terminal domain-containing protein [Halomonas utahensis]
MEFSRTLIALVMGSSLVMAGCELDDGDNDGNDARFELQLLHFADVDGKGGVQDVRNFSALVNGFRSQNPEKTLLVSSGDNLIPGPEFFAAGDDAMASVLGTPGNGRANIAWLNAMGVQASVVGNHDLDAGPESFTELLAEDGDWPGAQFPYLSANIDFEAAAAAETSDPSDLLTDAGEAAAPNTVAASATVEVNGETIGLVGASVPTLPSITSTGALEVAPSPFDPSAEEDLDELAATLQPAVDELADQGIDKIVLLAHMQQIAVEKALATRLTDVDIIVAGGSNTLLADSNDRLRDGDEAADTYPLEYESPAGEPVLLVNVDGDFQYLGRLMVSFDDQGRILSDSVSSAESGAYATDTIDRPFDPIERVDAITTALEEVLAEKDGNVVGQTDVYLDGRRSQVRTEETNLGNLTADANLWLAQQQDPNVEVSIKNGGGIRADIGQALQPPGTNDPDDITFLPPAANDAIGKPEGGISQLDIQTSLRFNNGLTLLTLTPAELADVMEHTVAATADGATPGQFPQIAGMRVEFDPTRAARSAGDTNQAQSDIAGERLRELEVLNPDGTVAKDVVTDGVVDTGLADIRIVILDFIAGCVGAPPGTACGDGYPLNDLQTPNRVDVTTDPGQVDFAGAGSEQDALAEYLASEYPDGAHAYADAETEPASDERIVDLSL